jgi:ferritin-like metal-binding protein YciE
MPMMRNLEDLFVEELKDIHDAEKRITKALPKMAKKATSEELKAALEEHLQQTEDQIGRLETIFQNLGKTPGRKTCEGMVGLLEEGQRIMEEGQPGSLLDAGLIAAAQKVEHYEMASYGCLRDWAQNLGHDEEAKLLQRTLDEEGETDKKLTEIAQSLNFDAAEEEEEMETVSTSRRPNGGTRSTGNRSRSR